MASKMTHEDVLAWTRGFQAAREAEARLTRREPVDVERSIRLALALIETCRRQGMWPRSRADTERERAVAAVRETWVKLKQALRS